MTNEEKIQALRSDLNAILNQYSSEKIKREIDKQNILKFIIEQHKQAYLLKIAHDTTYPNEHKAIIQEGKCEAYQEITNFINENIKT